MALWMAYAVVASALLGVAGAGMEAGLRALRQPGRWAPAVALLASSLLPLMGLLFGAGPLGPGPGMAGGPEIAPAGFLPRMASTSFLSALDRPLGVGWAASSLGILLLLLVTELRLLRMARATLPRTHRGIRFGESGDFGPAAVGCVRGVIVLPSWTRTLPSEALELILLHEREHVRAGDPRLLFAATLTLALQPWNVAIWWQLHRLRKAAELDCDQRLVRRGVDVRAYTDLLLQVSSRRGAASGLALAFAVGRRPSALARRVDDLTEFLARPRRGRAALGVLVGGIMASSAVTLPLPPSPLVSAPEAPQAKLLLAVMTPRDSLGGSELRTFSVEGEEAARLLRTDPGAAGLGKGGRIVRTIVRLPPGKGQPTPDGG